MDKPSRADNCETQVNAQQELMEHMPHEEAVLAQMLCSLREVREALLKNDLDAFSRALEQQAALAQTAEDLRTKRTQILQDFANSFDKKIESPTLGRVAEALSAKDSEWLMNCRERLQKMAAEAQQLNAQNAALVHQSVDLTRQVLTELTADGVGGASYNAAGARQDAVGHSMIELGG